MAKPTHDELEAQLKKTQEELDALAKDPTPSKPDVTPETPAPTPSKPDAAPSPSEPAASPSKETEEPPAPDKEPSPSEPDKEEKKEEKPVDWKKRYIDSTRQGQKNYEKSQAVLDAFERGEALPEPNDEEMKGMYAEWDKMSETERILAKEVVMNKRQNQLVVEALGKVTATHDWKDKVNKFLDDPKILTDYPDLTGREDEFRAYADDKEGVTTDLRYLVPSFLWDKKSSRVPKKGKMFETGGGVSSTRSRETGKVPYEQAMVLKKTNWKEYKRLLNAGKIENPITDAKE